jgi:hypothetical protein
MVELINAGTQPLQNIIMLLELERRGRSMQIGGGPRLSMRAGFDLFGGIG